MSAYNFLNSFTNGFMFGMLTSMPPVCSYNYFYTPYMSFPSIYMQPYPIMPLTYSFPMYTSPMIYQPYIMPRFNFSNINSNFNQNPYEYYYASPNYSINTYAANNSEANSGYYAGNSSYSTGTVQQTVSQSQPQLSTNTSSQANYQSNVSSSVSQTSSATHRTSSLQQKQTSNPDNENVTKLYTGSVDGLNKVLANKGVLKGKGGKFMEMQEKYGISASFLAAICIQESGGTSALATDSRNLHNVAGITTNGGRDWRKFNSVDECIEYLAQMLRNEYVNKGLVTIRQIHRKYCPPSGDPKDTKGINAGWGNAVSGIKNNIDKTVA